MRAPKVSGRNKKPSLKKGAVVGAAMMGLRGGAMMAMGLGPVGLLAGVPLGAAAGVGVQALRRRR